MPLTNAAKIISAGNLNSAIEAPVFSDYIALAVREMQGLLSDYRQVSAIATGSKKGDWNAQKNLPSLRDNIGDQHDFYEVVRAGTQNLGSGIQDFQIGDYILYHNTIWKKVTKERLADFTQAETHLALAYSIIPLNSRTSVDGGFLNAVGFQDSRNELLSIENAKALEKEYRLRAYHLLEKYLPSQKGEESPAEDAVIAPGIGFYRI